MPFSANSFFAFSFLAKCVRPIPRSTLGALVNWMLSHLGVLAELHCVEGEAAVGVAKYF
jgi:hypothetical protein